MSSEYADDEFLDASNWRDFISECEGDTDEESNTFEANPISPCRFFFGPSRSCKFGPKCKFNHNEAFFLQFHQLQRCTNFNQCQNYGKQKFCRGCTFQPCKNVRCSGQTNVNFTSSGFCKKCQKLTPFVCKSGFEYCDNLVRQEDYYCQRCYQWRKSQRVVKKR